MYFLTGKTLKIGLCQQGLSNFFLEGKALPESRTSIVKAVFTCFRVCSSNKDVINRSSQIVSPKPPPPPPPPPPLAYDSQGSTLTLGNQPKDYYKF